VLLVCLGPSADALDVGDHAAVAAAVRELAPGAAVVDVHAHDWARSLQPRYLVLPATGTDPRCVVGVARA